MSKIGSTVVFVAWESCSLRGFLVPFTAILLISAGVSRVRAGATFALDHEAKVAHDFAGARMPQWSGGALLAFTSNQTAAPVLLSFDDRGTEIRSSVLTIPGGETVNLSDIARGPDGTLAVCGGVYDHFGRGSGFIAVVDPAGDQITAVRLYPYYPSRITIAPDGTIWTAGLELVNGMEKGPGFNPEDGVIRRFDRKGKQLGSYIPRSTIASPVMVETGRLQSAKGRIGWYTGPFSGPGSEYYEILSDGTIRKYPTIDLAKWEDVTGLALTDDGNTYITTFGRSNHVNRFLSIGAPDQRWEAEPFPGSPDQVVGLYGGGGEQLVFWSRDRFKMTFVDVSR